MLDHTVSIEVSGHTALALHRRAHVREQMHARGVHPAEEGPIGPSLPLHEIDGGIRSLVVNCFHPLASERTGIFYLSIGKRSEDTARRSRLREGSVILGPGRVFRLLLRVEMVEVAIEFVEAVLGRQVL